jgi:hypothetical protein
MASSWRLGLCVAVAGAVVLLGCHEPSSRGTAGDAGSRTERVVSVPFGPQRQAVLDVRGFGRLSVRCARGQAVGVAYRNSSGGSQSASVQNGGEGASSDLAPGERLLRPGPLVGVQWWQVATISKAEVAVLRVSASATRLGSVACLVSARSEALRRPR